MVAVARDPAHRSSEDVVASIALVPGLGVVRYDAGAVIPLQVGVE